VLDIRARKHTSRAVDPIARLLAKIGIRPAAITIAGLAISIVGAVLIAFGYLAVGAGLVGLGALFDILDGVLARVTGTESVRGAFLDSFTDRIGEVAAFTGLAFYLGDRSEGTLVMLTLAGMAGSLLIPYLRAKAEAEGAVGKGGLMGRAERLLLFGFGVGLEGLGVPTLEVTVWAMAALTWLTVMQRFYRTWVQLGE
jgi:CDP-diacylglycerol--glycerol-3-phosphate 3-phosphatidyltransferase